MKKKILIRATRNGDVYKVKVIMKHPMDTGRSTVKKTGKKIPAHFIKEVTCLHNDKVVLEALWGVAVSKNPYLSFTLEKAQAGDKVTIKWLDNKGESESKSITL